MTVSKSCSLTAWISSILSCEPSVRTPEPRRLSSLPLRVKVEAVHKAPTWRLPKLAARRSAVLRARLAACRAPCPASKAPPESGRPRTPRKLVTEPRGGMMASAQRPGGALVAGPFALTLPSFNFGLISPGCQCSMFLKRLMLRVLSACSDSVGALSSGTILRRSRPARACKGPETAARPGSLLKLRGLQVSGPRRGTGL